jgi:hypothetical protein
LALGGISLTEEIDGQVIRIISPSDLIINLGYVDRIKKGDSAEVVIFGDEIFDTDGKSLGLYTFVKDDLEVTHVNRHFSVISKIRKRHAGNSPYSNLLEQMSKSISTIYGTSHEVEEPAKLKISSEEIEPLKVKAPADLAIHKGDEVRVIHVE